MSSGTSIQLHYPTLSFPNGNPLTLLSNVYSTVTTTRFLCHQLLGPAGRRQQHYDCFNNSNITSYFLWARIDTPDRPGNRSGNLSYFLHARAGVDWKGCIFSRTERVSLQIGTPRRLWFGFLRGRLFCFHMYECIIPFPFFVCEGRSEEGVGVRGKA